MATIVLTDCSLVWNSVDLSNRVNSITIDYSAELLSDTTMGDTFQSRIAGLKDWSASVEFMQDYASGSVDATLFAGVGTSATFVGKPESGSVSATNPSFTGACILENHQPINGSVGEVATVSVTFQGNGTLARATS